MNDPNSRSNFCKTKCIDEDLIFCPNSQFTGGNCCERTESCPKYEFCSNTSPGAPTLFKYLSCPNEPACEEKEIYPSYSNEILMRSIDKYTYKFVKNDICGYIIYAPW